MDREKKKKTTKKKRLRALFLFFIIREQEKKYSSKKKKKKELFITISRVSIQRVYYNDAFTPYDVVIELPLCVVSHYYSGNEKCIRCNERSKERRERARQRQKKGRWCFV